MEKVQRQQMEQMSQYGGNSMYGGQYPYMNMPMMGMPPMGYNVDHSSEVHTITDVVFLSPIKADTIPTLSSKQ